MARGIRKRIRKRLGKAVNKGKELVRKAIKDPLVWEYAAKQKKLARSTLKKALKRVERRL